MAQRRRIDKEAAPREPRLVRMAHVIDNAISASGLSKAEIGRRVGKSASSITRISSNPLFDGLAELDLLSAAIGVDTGTLLTRAGYLPADTTTVDEALRNDPSLTPAVRDALLVLYLSARSPIEVQLHPRDDAYALAADQQQGPIERGPRVTRPAPPAEPEGP